METLYEFGPEVGRMVYVKPVDVTDLPEDVQAQAGDAEQLFAVHDADGQQLALVAERRMAYALARQHDYVPQAVH